MKKIFLASITALSIMVMPGLSMAYPQGVILGACDGKVYSTKTHYTINGYMYEKGVGYLDEGLPPYGVAPCACLH